LTQIIVVLLYGVQLHIPAVLKKRLVDEWVMINENNRIAPLPRHPTAADVLQQYVDMQREAAGDASTCENEATVRGALSAQACQADLGQAVGAQVVGGLRKWLDSTLRHELLYKPEWSQADAVRSHGKCVVYCLFP
jgi:hypothetical protein